MVSMASLDPEKTKFYGSKLGVKNSTLFVKNVVGACIYLGLEHLTVLFGFT